MFCPSYRRSCLPTTPRGKEQTVLDIFKKWDLEASVCGVVTDTGRATITWQGKVVADMPAAPLADEAPRYDRPRERPAWQDDLQMFDASALPVPDDLGATLVKIVTHPNMASKRWVYRQYDHMVGADTVIAPGADAAVVRIDGTDKGVACVSDCNSRWVYLDPYEGAAMAVIEAARNLSCVGAKPLAITDCLNFGNPERPDIMWQFYEAMRGMGEACRQMDTPVISGNVSLYNETEGKAIHPTPTVGMVGLIEPASKALAGGFKQAGDTIAILGAPEGTHLGGSTYLYAIHEITRGRPPKPQFEEERNVQEAVRTMVLDELLTTAHDISDGGIAAALADCTFGGDRPGCTVTLPGEGRVDARLFGEDGARIVVAYDASNASAIKAIADKLGVALTEIGQTGGDRLVIGDAIDVELSALREGWENGFADAVGL